jgi:tRNA (guanine6-N2)-methyltransferase
MPGLQEIAWTEVRARIAGASFEAFQEFPDKNGIVLFRSPGDAASLLDLRTTEDIFYLVQRLPKVEWGRAGLSEIFQAIERNRFIEGGLAIHRQTAGRRGSGPRTFRVISRLSGRSHPFRRIDFERAVQRALRNRLGRSWRPVADGGDVEFWANLVGLDFICGLRLSDASMRHRGYKQAHIAASLRPSVAASLVWLTEPQSNDVFLDPMCGAGTILVERGLAGPHGILLGGDIRPEALGSAAENIGPRHKPRQLLHWDARHLPLRSGTVDKIATNPPFGRQLGSHRENRALYGAFCDEISRVLRPSGRVAMITSETELVRDSVRGAGGLSIVRGYAATVLGQRATVYLIERP